MAISNVPTEPGAFSQFNPTATFPVIPGSIRVAALVGKGRQTNKVNGETVIKGALDGSDALANTAVILGSTLIDEDGNTYNLTTDYILTSGAVDWSPNTPATLTGTETETFDLSGNDKILKITVADANGGLEQSYTFVDGDFAVPAAATALEVKSAINVNIDGVVSTDAVGAVVITTDNGNNTSLLIGDGTANSILGFVDGSLLVTPREPAPAKTYRISYEYAKVTADYTPRFYFSMTDIINDFGEVSTANTVSLGAEIVFQHGASAVNIIQIDPADGAEVNQFRKAIDKLANISDINIVVALSTDLTLHSYLKTHVNTASSITERKERTAIVGMSGTLTSGTITTQAQSLADKRIVLVSATEGERFVGSDLTTSILDGSFISARICGVVRAFGWIIILAL